MNEKELEQLQEFLNYDEEPEENTPEEDTEVKKPFGNKKYKSFTHLLNKSNFWYSDELDYCIPSVYRMSLYPCKSYTEDGYLVLGKRRFRKVDRKFYDEWVNRTMKVYHEVV